MPGLPDPRRYGMSAGDAELASLLARNEDGDAAARGTLLTWLARCLEQGDDRKILDALQQAPSQSAYRALWDLVDRAAGGAAGEKASIEAQAFALPIVIVTAARQPARVPEALPDINEIRVLLEQHGAVGLTRNFGLSNALCPLEALERLKPSEVYRWRADWAGGGTRDIPPRDIVPTPGREEVHLRFLLGAGITPKDVPSFLETAANIGAWGLALTRVLVRQLARPGLELLPMPRAPTSLLKAPHSGRWAQLEAAFNLFASDALRNFRSAVGDPVVIISAHRLEAGIGDVRVSLSSPLDDTLLEGFRWPLHPLDDLPALVRVVSDLMQECRVSDINVVDVLLPDHLDSGLSFARARDLASLSLKKH